MLHTLEFLDDFLFAFVEATENGESVAEALEVANDYSQGRQADDRVPRHRWETLTIAHGPATAGPMKFSAHIAGQEESGIQGYGLDETLAIRDLIHELMAIA